MKKETSETGTKGTIGTASFFPHTCVHTNADGVAGVNIDSDLDWVPDGETVSEGSEPHTPLPVFCQENDIWPRMLQGIVDHGRTPQQRDVLLLSAIDVIGATLNRRVRTLYNGRWLSPNLMLFVVAPPASGKGVMSWVRYLAQPFHDEVRRQVEREMRDYRVKKMKFDSLGREKVNVDEKDIPVLPKNRMFLIPGNNSGTGIQTNIINSDGIGLIFETEADTLSTSLNADYGHFDDALRNTYDHEGLRFHRRTENEYMEVKRTYLSMVLSGTPAQVKPLIPSAENGLFSRFLYYYMPPVRRWVSQFDRKEDMNEWFRRLGLEWKKRLDARKDVSLYTFELTADQQEYTNIFLSSIFSRAMHSLGEEAISTVFRLAPQMMRIMSVVAFLRALEDDGFRPDPVVLKENLLDGICPRMVYGIENNDFMRCLTMADTLFRHAMHVLSLLPAVEVSNRCSADKEALFSAMPDPFTRKEYLDKVGEMEIAENTALQWLKRGMRKGLFLKIDRGVYRFVHDAL